MTQKHKAAEDYKSFGSQHRGTEEIEKELESVVLKKQTPENIDFLASSLAVDWNLENENVARLKLAFKDLEKKIEKLKPELAKKYVDEKEKLNSTSRKETHIHDSNAI